MRIRNELNAYLYKQKMNDVQTPYPAHNLSFLNLICNGNIQSVRKQLAVQSYNSSADERVLSADALRNAVYHFVLSASSIAEACMSAGLGNTEAYALADIYIQNADRCKNEADLPRLYYDMCMDFTERMNEIRRETVMSLHIRKCINHIYENLGSDLSVQALARIIDLNPTYLSRLFREEVGIPLKQFVKEARVDTAQNLLKYSELSYSVIANSLGFSTQSSFIAVFKDITGMTPKKYRDKNYAGK